MTSISSLEVEDTSSDVMDQWGAVHCCSPISVIEVSSTFQKQEGLARELYSYDRRKHDIYVAHTSQVDRLTALHQHQLLIEISNQEKGFLSICVAFD